MFENNKKKKWYLIVKIAKLLVLSQLNIKTISKFDS